MFNINSSKPIKEINIYNIIGKQILTENPSSAKLTLDLTGFDKGIYFVNIRYADHSLFTSKILIR
jgi:hypothetical protein